jgi:hypothetical protein
MLPAIEKSPPASAQVLKRSTAVVFCEPIALWCATVSFTCAIAGAAAAAIIAAAVSAPRVRANRMSILP